MQVRQQLKWMKERKEGNRKVYLPYLLRFIASTMETYHRGPLSPSRLQNPPHPQTHPVPVIATTKYNIFYTIYTLCKCDALCKCNYNLAAALNQS